MRLALAALALVHGLIHLLGVAKAFGLADLPALTQPISRASGVGWGLAATLFIVSAALLGVAPRAWWPLGLVAVVLSEAVIVGSWSDARFGTLPNLVLGASALLAVVQFGPASLWSEYRADVATIPSVRTEPITADELAALPTPIRRYLETAGVVGTPHVLSFRAEMTGRIRGEADAPWMPFTAEQHNSVTPARRYFWMSATRGGLPVSVYHRFGEAGATMRVRLLGAVPIADAAGPEMTRAETVTLLNDLCILAPGSLVDAPITWSPVSDTEVDAAYTLGANTVRARIIVDAAGHLVDFRSEDRLRAAADGSTFTPLPWRTPMDRHGSLGGVVQPTHGDARWVTPQGDLVYIEMDITRVVLNPS